MSTLESVATMANLSNEPLRLYSLFHVGSRIQSVFFEAQGELFTVHENGTLEYCLGPSHEHLERRLRECQGCAQVFAGRINATEVSEKWSRLCRAKGNQAELADPRNRLGFVCQPKPEPTTATTTTTTTTTTTEIVTTTERLEIAGGTTSDEEEVPESDGKRAASTANGAVVPVVTAVLLLASVALVLFVWRAKLAEIRERCRGAPPGQ